MDSTLPDWRLRCRGRHDVRADSVQVEVARLGDARLAPFADRWRPTHAQASHLSRSAQFVDDVRCSPNLHDCIVGFPNIPVNRQTYLSGS